MRWVLTGLNRLEMEKDPPRQAVNGFRELTVQFCAVCRTDAKMWQEGHRDLHFPRVPGHEFVGVDSTGRRFSVWPGKSCGSCRYCRTDRENLCEAMKITGFHHDGGFAYRVVVPEESLIPVPKRIPSHLACFAEPVGCVVHALDALHLHPEERIVIYGGGTVGLIAALVAQNRGAVPLVIEKSEEKIHRIRPFLSLTGIDCGKDTPQSEFDAAITACPDPAAYGLALSKLAKGGRISFFSGLKKNQNLETNLINLMHYREHALFGAYGLTPQDMVKALMLIEKKPKVFETLVEEIVPFARAPELMEKVLSGKPLKYILDITQPDGQPPVSEKKTPSPKLDDRQTARGKLNLKSDSLMDRTIAAIKPVNTNLLPAAQHKIDNKTKPLGSLGKLESAGIRMSLIQNRLDPVIRRKALLVFAGDHGITEEGVSAFPAEVTQQMVLNFLNGGAAINVLCRHHNIALKVVDMGVNGEFEDHPELIKKKVRKGTRNFAIQDAMTRQEAQLAVASGMDAFLQEYEKSPIQIVGLGEMGIGNTTSATAIICSVTGIRPGDATGRGTGVDDKGLSHKMKIIQKALDFHSVDSENGMEILQKIGGFELAGIAGAVLAAAAMKCAVVLDGLISTAAGLAAYQICPDIGGYLFSGHKSVEVAQKAALDHMGLDPLIDFNMRLGEGTGAAFAIDTIDASCRIMREMASFDEAGVSHSE